MSDKEFSHKLLRLLERYYHFKFMSRVLPGAKMSLYDFMTWLGSIDE